MDLERIRLLAGIEQITEARKNPKQNKKVDTLSQIKQSAREYPNSFVTFTTIDKVGINPRTEFATPIGIYSYPIQYVIDEDLDLPYPNKYNHIIIFEPNSNANIITIDQLNKMKPQLDQAIHKILGKLWNSTTNNMWHHVYNNIQSNIQNKSVQYNGRETVNKRQIAIIARKIFTTANIDGIVDDNDSGTIHSNEQTQAVFFSKSNIRVIKQIFVSNKQYNNDKVSLHDVIQYNKYKSIPKWIQDAFDAHDFVHAVNKPIPELEHLLLTNTSIALEYSQNILKHRWPELEHLIIKDPAKAFYYAKDVIKNRWPEAEPYIMKDPGRALYYAKDVIKNRWPEAEPYIKQLPRCWELYLNDVVKNQSGMQH